VNILGDSRKILPVVNKQRFIAPLEQMPPYFVSCIESLSIGPLKPSHSIHQIGFRSFQKQMIVIPHQRKGINMPPGTRTDFSECIKKQFVVSIISENRFLPVPATHHMIDRAGIFYAGFTSHRFIKTKSRVARQQKELNNRTDPFSPFSRRDATRAQKTARSTPAPTER